MSLPNYSALALQKTKNFASAALPLIYLAKYIIKNKVEFYTTIEFLFQGEYVNIVLVWYFLLVLIIFPLQILRWATSLLPSKS